MRGWLSSLLLSFRDPVRAYRRASLALSLSQAKEDLREKFMQAVREGCDRYLKENAGRIQREKILVEHAGDGFVLVFPGETLWESVRVDFALWDRVRIDNSVGSRAASLEWDFLLRRYGRSPSRASRLILNLAFNLPRAHGL